MKRVDLQAVLGLKHQESFRDVYLIPAMTAGWVEMTIPEKPNSSKQRYRLTRRGAELQATLQTKNLKP
jgi:ATP-dependent DNA helicase RecG